MSYEDLLKTNVDAVLIAGDETTHAAQALQAAHAGKHILVDKPLAMNSGDRDMILEAMAIARDKGLVFTTCLPRQAEDVRYPYGWAYQQLPTLVSEFGPLKFILLDFSYSQPSPRRSRVPLILDHAVHDVNAAIWLASRVRGESGALYVRRSLHDDGLVEYSAAGNFALTRFFCHGTRLIEREDVFTETILLRFAGGECHIDTFTGQVTLKQHGGEGRKFGVMGMHSSADHGARLRAVMSAFADAIAEGEGGGAYLSPSQLELALEVPIALYYDGYYAIP